MRIAYFLFLCGTAWAQQLEIRGSVIESPGNLGIAGVEVTLTEFVEDDTRTVVRKPSATAATDARGAFVFHPGHVGDYYVEVKKTGYANVNNFAPGGFADTVAGTPVSVSREHPSADVTPFSLSRPGELSGRVIDEDGKPVAGLTVWVQSPLADSFLSAPTVTDKDGAFTRSKLGPGDYVVRIAPQSGNLETLTPRFAEDDLKVIDQDLEISYWPGGTLDSRTATPMRVSPGASTSVGTIVARKVPYYRVHVSVRQADCGAGETWTFSVGDSAGAPLDVLSRGYGALPCTKDFLVGHLKAGSYWFALMNGQDSQATMWALAPVEITDKNLAVELTMARGVDVPGRVIGFEGAALPPARSYRFGLTPVIGGFIQPPLLDAEGEFLIHNVLWPRHRVMADVQGNYYIKEIRYNGQPVVDGIVTPIQGTQLEIVIDDRPAALTGSVTDGDKPASQATVYLTKWPAAPTNPVIKRTAIGSDGTYRITGLAPGEYRAIAMLPLPIDEQLKLTNDVLIGLLSHGERVILERGGSQSVALKLGDPRR